LLKRRLIAREGRHLTPPATGVALIERLPVPTLASPELTGAWEARLARVARGEDTRAAFMTDIARYIREITDAVRAAPRAGLADADAARDAAPAPPRAPAAGAPAKAAGGEHQPRRPAQSTKARAARPRRVPHDEAPAR